MHKFKILNLGFSIARTGDFSFKPEILDQNKTLLWDHSFYTENRAIHDNHEGWFRAQQESPFENIFELSGNADNCFGQHIDSEDLYKKKIEININKEKNNEDGNFELISSEEESYYSDKADIAIENDNKAKIDPKNKVDVSEFQVSTKIEIGKEEVKQKKKNGKSLTLAESRRKLALRADVMNKNFFRALRREVKNLFEDYLDSNGFSTSKSKRVFRSNLKRYTEHFLEELKQDQKEFKGN